MLRAFAWSVPTAVFLAVTGDDSDPDWWQGVVGAAFVIGPLALGWFAGWWAAPALSASYVAAVVAYERWLATPDPSCDPCVGGEVALPFVVVLALIGAAIRAGGEWTRQA